jgi:hypothetical protein
VPLAPTLRPLEDRASGSRHAPTGDLRGAPGRPREQWYKCASPG